MLCTRRRAMPCRRVLESVPRPPWLHRHSPRFSAFPSLLLLATAFVLPPVARSRSGSLCTGAPEFSKSAWPAAVQGPLRRRCRTTTTTSLILAQLICHTGQMAPVESGNSTAVSQKMVYRVEPATLDDAQLLGRLRAASITPQNALRVIWPAGKVSEDAIANLYRQDFEDTFALPATVALKAVSEEGALVGFGMLTYHDPSEIYKSRTGPPGGVAQYWRYIQTIKVNCVGRCTSKRLMTEAQTRARDRAAQGKPYMRMSRRRICLPCQRPLSQRSATSSRSTRTGARALPRPSWSGSSSS
jgi:hypothetical protein